MVKKPRVSVRRYKKCLLSTIRGSKIKTPGAAQKAFHKASRKCKHFLGIVDTPKKRKRKSKVSARSERGFHRVPLSSRMAGISELGRSVGNGSSMIDWI